MNTAYKPKILLVDDEESILSTLKMFLELSGFQVVTASNGLEALAKVSERRPDLIVLDVLMPQLDGRETLRRLRQRGDGTPVILLTQVTGTAQRIMAIEEGADDYLNKPFDPQELAARIKAVLRRTQAGKQPLQSTRRLKSRHVSMSMAVKFR
jgi:DNA-binding response OmpR family regulator